MIRFNIYFDSTDHLHVLNKMNMLKCEAWKKFFLFRLMSWIYPKWLSLCKITLISKHDQVHIISYTSHKLPYFFGSLFQLPRNCIFTCIICLVDSFLGWKLIFALLTLLSGWKSIQCSTRSTQKFETCRKSSDLSKQNTM